MLVEGMPMKRVSRIALFVFMLLAPAMADDLQMQLIQQETVSPCQNATAQAMSLMVAAAPTAMPGTLQWSAQYAAWSGLVLMTYASITAGACQ
jgi:hypothetical protein